MDTFADRTGDGVPDTGTSITVPHAALADVGPYAECILNSVGDGLCQVDEAGLVTFINPAGAQLLGYQPAEMLGKNAHLLFHHSHADGRDYPQEECNGRAAMYMDRPHSVDNEVFWRKDGSSFPVHYVSAPMRVDGVLRGTVLTFRDTSNENATRKSLLESKVKLRKAQEIAGFGSYVTELSTGLWESNAQLDGILGVDACYRHDVSGWVQLIDPEFRQSVLDHFRQALDGAGDFRVDYRITRPSDGASRWLAANGEVERDAQGNPLRLVGTVQDITERVEAKNQLLQLNETLESRVLERTRELASALDSAELAKRSRGQFLANMSHEIRTPMNTVMGMVHLALKTQPVAPMRHYLERIQQSGAHLLTMINDILDFSKIDAGKLQLESDTLDTQEILQHIIQLTEGKAVEKGLSLHLELDPAVPRFVRGDALRLSQILINFLNNAVKFTEQGGIVLRALVPQQDHSEYSGSNCRLRFEVQDTGIGVDEDQTARLFKSFEQGDNSTTRKFGGTGLGLAISRQLATLMHGTVGVSSRLGVGSTFWLEASLEIAPEPDYNSIPSSDVADAIRSVAGGRVLVVDDNDFNLDVAKGLLQDADVMVEVARDGSQAIEALLQSAYDCVLMDVQMPVMDGLEATRRIRKHPLLHRTVVIAMTANAGHEDRAICLAAGMNEVIVKPVDPDALFLTLANWLGPQGAHPLESTTQESPERSAVGTAATTSVVDPVQTTDHLVASPVWDANALSRIVGNNQDAHVRLLRNYRSAAYDMVTAMGQCAVRGEWPQAADLAHKLKSSSRSVGAMRLGDLCEALERAGRGGNGPACAALVESVAASFAEVDALILT